MLKVVVVDDSVAIQRSLGRLLASISGVDLAGFAEDVTGAISLIDMIQPDVVVLDVNLLHGEKGIDVLRYVRRQKPHTQVVALSNTASSSVRDHYLDAGAAAIFDKSTEFMQARDWIAARSASSPSPGCAGRDPG